MVESAGNAPAWACLQGKCITCLPRPQEFEIGNRPGAAPGKLSFGDSAARVGARLKMGIGAAAGSCARTFALARRHSAAKSQPHGK